MRQALLWRCAGGKALLLSALVRWIALKHLVHFWCLTWRQVFSTLLIQGLVVKPINEPVREGAFYNSTTIDPRFVQFSSRARKVRGVLLGFSWTFGKPIKDEDLLGTPAAP